MTPAATQTPITVERGNWIMHGLLRIAVLFSIAWLITGCQGTQSGYFYVSSDSGGCYIVTSDDSGGTTKMAVSRCLSFQAAGKLADDLNRVLLANKVVSK